MPGKGKLETRAFTAEEAVAPNVGQASRLPGERASASIVPKVPSAAPSGAGETPALLLPGHATHDIFLNEAACRRNVPEKDWDYTIGGSKAPIS